MTAPDSPDRHVGKCYRCRALFQAGSENMASLTVGYLAGRDTYRVELCSACIGELRSGKSRAKDGPHV